MARDVTEAQLRVGAEALAYRAWQLAGTVPFVTGREEIRASSGRAATTIANALVESALTNARALAWFFHTEPSRSDIRHRMYVQDDWTDAVLEVAPLVEEPVSVHLSHATRGDPEGEKHPGAWPISELAVVLVGGLHRLTEALDDDRRRWFSAGGLDPAETYQELKAVDPLAQRPEVSQNKRVAPLTQSLREHLDRHGY